MWAGVRGPGWQPGNVTQYLYGRLVRGDDPDFPSPLPVGVNYAIVVAARDDDLDALIVDDEMEPQEAGECSDLYPVWAVGTTYVVDDLVSYDDALWKCRQPHTATDPGWIPTNVLDLWLRYRKNADQLLDWVVGERVLLGWQRTYNGGTYQVIQEHVTQNDWPPDLTVGVLWSVVSEPTEEWAVGVAYKGDNTAGVGNGDVVTYLGNTYRCLQSHTSIITWNPVATLNVSWVAV